MREMPAYLLYLIDFERELGPDKVVLAPSPEEVAGRLRGKLGGQQMECGRF